MKDAVCAVDKGTGGGGGQKGVGGAYSFVACLSHLTIDHASFRDGAPFLLQHLQHLGAHYGSSIYYIKIVCLSYPRPVSPSAATI